MQPNFIAGYLVGINNDEEPVYLLLRRSKQVYLPGIWQIVTGKINQDEKADCAVKREIFEETGLKIDKIYSVDVTMFYEQFKGAIAFSANYCAFVDCLAPIHISESEHNDFQWCNYEQLHF